MKTASAKSPYKTGVIWGVLGALLLVGTLSAAFFVYGLTDAFSAHRYLLDALAMGIGGAIAVYVILLMAGIMYRIDRLRGVAHRRVELFE